MKELGIVVIGRNEGVRLQRCIGSLLNLNSYIVYVDSGSTDDSVTFVKQYGVDVVELDMSIPFSAARARNAGYQFLLKKYSNITFLQFIDGDCEIANGWVDIALHHLKKYPKLASVCGRRREKYLNKSIYNKLCDIEWDDTPIGITKSTGGDFMCRKEAIVNVNGFSDQVVAGEEPEMCFRMMQCGWVIERLNQEMTVHDADITRLMQWCKRLERSGHAYAQGFSLHRKTVDSYCRSDVLRILLWSLIFPFLILLAVFFWGYFGFLFSIVFPVKIMQLTLRYYNTYGLYTSFAYSSSLVLGKFPQLIGLIRFFWKYAFGKNPQIIEYKC